MGGTRGAFVLASERGSTTRNECVLLAFGAMGKGGSSARRPLPSMRGTLARRSLDRLQSCLFHRFFTSR
ncbi:hypothetical protein BU14_1481s0001 [Porphyra umbilicalis]|uniref:Uncharacterized protein n=1 Tax=Porphyra umbilicalis TaxID=2786 RepID=A0A1X6NLE7_PORUM|nr:hypothetical protein BU14_1481s0001 [Porphyra umbilicalis]|eukprot:OSX69469.1 hypothetical protein BU14_1481s0001 [Porphyra umbilicalis]